MEVLHEFFGEGSRIIIHRVLRVLYEKYSLPVDFSDQETLLDQLTLLRDRIVVEHLRPGGVEYADRFPDKEAGPRDQDSSTKSPETGLKAVRLLVLQETSCSESRAYKRLFL